MFSCRGDDFKGNSSCVMVPLGCMKQIYVFTRELIVYMEHKIASMNSIVRSIVFTARDYFSPPTPFYCKVNVSCPGGVCISKWMTAILSLDVSGRRECKEGMRRHERHCRHSKELSHFTTVMKLEKFYFHLHPNIYLSMFVSSGICCLWLLIG